LEYMIYMMWEALYYRSEALQPLLEREERECTELFRHRDDLTVTGFWRILNHLYYWAVVKREDVEKLPDPIEYI